MEEVSTEAVGFRHHVNREERNRALCGRTTRAECASRSAHTKLPCTDSMNQPESCVRLCGGSQRLLRMRYSCQRTLRQQASFALQESGMAIDATIHLEKEAAHDTVNEGME